MMAVFPLEILLPILIRHLRNPETTLYQALSLRLLSRDIDAEVLHQLFTLGQLDVKDHQLRGKHADLPRLCRLCLVPTRPELRHKAINRVTVHRYLVGWLTRACYYPGDTELAEEERFERREMYKVWKTMRGAIRLYDESTRAASLESPFEPTPEDRTCETCWRLADAVITMYGVRDTWTYFGPHNEADMPNYHKCAPQHCSELPTLSWTQEGMFVWRSEPWTDEFWCLVLAAYDGNLDSVRSFLNGLGMGPDGEWAECVANLRPSGVHAWMLDNWSTIIPHQISKQWRYQMNCLAAAATIAVRKGHRDVIWFLFEVGMAKKVCCYIRFWSGRTVFGTLLATTAHTDSPIAAVAVETIEKLIVRWRVRGLRVDRWWCIEHLKSALDIPTKSGILLMVIETLLPSHSRTSGDEEILHRMLFHVLCQAAITNDLERAEIAAKAASLTGELVVVGSSKFGKEHAYGLNMSADEDEYGVRSSRFMDVLNPVRIAAALSHVEVLEWLLDPGRRQLLDSLKPWQLKARTRAAYLSLERHASTQVSKQHILWDARREAVHDIFIYQDRLPISTRPTMDTKCLKLILNRSRDLSWGHETIATAGLKSTNIFQAFVDHTDLGKKLLHNTSKAGQEMFAEGFRARTVGERALQHALKTGRFDNARILLKKAVVLAEPVKPDGIYDDNPVDMARLKGLQEVEVPGMRLMARTMKVLYWVDEDVQPGFEQTKRIEGIDRQFIWKDGRKVKRIDIASAQTS